MVTMYRWFMFTDSGKVYCSAPSHEAARKILGGCGSIYLAVVA